VAFHVSDRHALRGAMQSVSLACVLALFVMAGLG
jgi:hypothetical protein